MKLKLVTGESEVKPDLELKVSQVRNQIIIETLDSDGDAEWSVATVGVKDGKLVIARHTGIDDARISTNADEADRIEEVDENDLENE